MEDRFLRYSRQIFVEEVGVAGQRKIFEAKVLVIGAGGLGAPIIQYLAAAGIKTLAVADYDRVEIHNLHRQVIHHEDAIGRLKVESAEIYVKSANSEVDFRAIPERINTDNVCRILEPYDIIIDGSDNFSTRYLINDACVAMGKVLVYGSVLSFEGQIAVFNYKGSKNLRDIFPEPPHENDVPDCDQNGVLGPLTGIIGSMMAMQCLKIILDLQVDTGTLLLVNAKDWIFNKVSF